jgi:tRNA pseudouridine55 synthase
MRDGLLLVDKTGGCTSHDVVQRARRLLGQRRIGHCGTLDPDATGLLLLTLGHATRLTRFLIRAPKVYEGRIRFGVETDTYDASGAIVAQRPIDGLTTAALVAAMPALEGTYEQSLPRYCAKKSGGVRYYEMARRGEEVPETSKEVTVYSFVATGELEDGTLGFRLACSSGTYARSLAHDLGQRLEVGGLLSQLRRTQIGGFSIADAATLEEIARRLGAAEPLAPAWIDFDRIPLPFADVAADAQQEQRIVNGQTILVRESAAAEGDWVRLVNRRGQFIAVGSVIESIGERGVGVVQPKIVFK